MIKAHTPFSPWVLLIVLGLCLPCLADVALYKQGKPVASIVVMGPLEEDVPQTKTRGQGVVNVSRQLVVEELNSHFEKLFGQRLPVVVMDQPRPFDGPAILLGELAVDTPVTQTSSAKEGFRIRTAGNQVMINAESDQGLLWGSYHLLRTLGYEWVMPGDIGVVLPEAKEGMLIVPEMDQSKAPDFLIRRIFFTGIRQNAQEHVPRQQEWQRRQYGAFNPHPATETAGHNWDRITRKYKKVFDANPEMYALVRQADGTFKRQGPQLESTHPQVIELFKQEIREMFAKNNWPSDKAVGVPIGPADGLGYSQSTESRLAGTDRIDPNAGEQDTTDLVVLLANTILKDLEDEFPNLYLGYYVYSTHAEYPARYTPHPRVVPIFAPINYSRFHGIGDTNSKTWPSYADVVRQWAALSDMQGNPLLYRGYSWNIADNYLPFIKAHVWGDEIPFYKKHNFIGATVQGVKAWNIQGPSDYVLMHLLFDSSQDWHKLLANYCDKAYGQGGPAMLSYYDRLTRKLRDSGIESGSYHAYPLIFDQQYLKIAQADLDKARDMAKLPNEKTRVEYVAMSHHSLKLFLAFDGAVKAFDFAQAHTNYKAMQDHWQAMYDVNPDLACELGRAYLKRFMERFAREAEQFSTEPYKIVYRIPEQLPTLFDPTVSGHANHYFAPDLNDAHYLKTRTWSSTWDVQGLSPIKRGAVWYRVRFTLPKSTGDQPVGLFLGSFEDEARVYLNGQFVGTSGRRFSIPAQYDLTDFIKPDQENLLAIQVVKNLNINELGLGGLIRPSFIFTGPRLPERAPRQIDLSRPLPGAGDVK